MKPYVTEGMTFTDACEKSKESYRKYRSRLVDVFNLIFSLVFSFKKNGNFLVWDCLACHSFSFKTLSYHGLGMACHGRSQDVT